MHTITLRTRSVAWFVTGGLLAAAVMLMFANAWRVDAAPGDTDTTFVPITPCRLEDTRQTHFLNGPSTTVFQGTGSVGKCAVPSEAVALLLNVTAIKPEKQSFLTFWADGSRPDAASLNPAPGQPPTPNAVVVPLASDGSFSVYNNNGAVDITMDVNGYYTKKNLKDIEARLNSLENGNSTDVENRLLALEGAAAVIPSGNVLFGQIDFNGEDFANEDWVVQVPLNAVIPTELTANTVNFGAASTGPASADVDATCTGSASQPSAPAGKVCVYLVSSFGVSAMTARQVEVVAGSPDARSFAIDVLGNASGDMNFQAVWAYTAP